MMHFSKSDIKDMPGRYRANLLNCISGWKPVNLVGTVSSTSKTNLAVFNSVQHIGSNPALIGILFRPLTVRRDTYYNIKQSRYFTINQVHSAILRKAHLTAAKFEEGVSEFDKSGLSEEYLNSFKAPFVRESSLRLGCSYQGEYLIKENGTILLLGAVELISVDEGLVHEDGWINLSKSKAAVANGLDGYGEALLLDRLKYARPDEPVQSLENGT